MKRHPISIAIVFGTRPEAVKLLPVIRLMKKHPEFSPRVIVTGQHREMVEEILQPFGLTPDVDLGIMQPKQTLNDIICRAMPLLDELYAREKPDFVLVQGDTTSAFCAALAAFDRRIPVGHVEAGLRSFDRYHPYPEESNRRMLTALAELHFAPTVWAAQNLLQEGTPANRVIVTGNTVIDALFLSLRHQILVRDEEDRPNGGSNGHSGGVTVPRRSVLITLHRREAWETPSDRKNGDGHESLLDGILRGIRVAAEARPEVDFVYPMHLNPNVRAAAERALGSTPNVKLIEPLPYLKFVGTMARASVIVTDSGGVQEEAPSLGIPVLILRKTTERPEAVRAGTSRLVGTDAESIRTAVCAALDEPRDLCGPTLPRPNPFGDGRASGRILQAILHYAGEADAPEEFLGSPTPELNQGLATTRWPADRDGISPSP